MTVAKGGPGERRGADLELARLHRPGQERHRRRVRDSRPASTSTYIEDINDNDTFFSKLQPQLEQGSSGGRSLFVVTDWMAKRMYDLGYLQQIDHADLPTVFQNILPQSREPELRTPAASSRFPGRAAMTGIWVDTSKAPEIHSVNDLFDPKYKGKVTMLDRDARHRPAGHAEPRGSTRRTRPRRTG